jgi:ferritin-like protein
MVAAVCGCARADVHTALAHDTTAIARTTRVLMEAKRCNVKAYAHRSTRDS